MRAITFRAIAGLLLTLGLAAPAAAELCSAPRALVEVRASLPRTLERIRAGHAVVIVALGSSSTAGAGASRPEYSYPARLEAILARAYPKTVFHVVNKGVGGDLTQQMLARIDSDVLSAKPDLVIWQLGTNAILNDASVAEHAAAIRVGIRRLKEAGVEVLLMDPQYAPRVVAKLHHKEFVSLIAAIGAEEKVPVFRRFAIMADWAARGDLGMAALLSPDQLHLNDLSYDCIARRLAETIGYALGPEMAPAAQVAASRR